MSNPLQIYRLNRIRTRSARDPGAVLIQPPRAARSRRAARRRPKAGLTNTSLSVHPWSLVQAARMDPHSGGDASKPWRRSRPRTCATTAK